MSTKLRVNILAEKFIGEANGVTTAVLEMEDALKKRPELEVMVNSSGPYDVLHAHSIGWDYVMKTGKGKTNTVVSAHVVPDSFIGSLIFSRLWRPMARWFLKFVYNRAALVLAVSPTVKRELEKIGVKTPIRVLCNSVDRHKFKPDSDARHAIRGQLGIGMEEKVVISVGQVQPRKGMADFMETARALPRVRFVWVGGRPFGRLTEEYDKMTNLIKNAPSNVIFTGIVPFSEMPRYYAASDIYFMPSFQENFAFATVEGASVKLPLVMRDNPEYPDTLLGHYLKASDAAGFTAVIRRLVEDPGFFAEWQSHSDALASAYEVGAHTEALVKVYKEISSQKK
jgi:1,2-diacylglycerol-3-alpha-glucose alpha-1,2-galactosyltransferase